MSEEVLSREQTINIRYGTNTVFRLGYSPCNATAMYMALNNSIPWNLDFPLYKDAYTMSISLGGSKKQMR